MTIHFICIYLRWSSDALNNVIVTSIIVVQYGLKHFVCSLEWASCQAKAGLRLLNGLTKKWHLVLTCAPRLHQRVALDIILVSVLPLPLLSDKLSFSARNYIVPSFSSDSYMQLTRLVNAETKTSIDIQFRSTTNDGIILYNGQNNDARGDFISLAVKGGYVEFRWEKKLLPITHYVCTCVLSKVRRLSAAPKEQAAVLYFIHQEVPSIRQILQVQYILNMEQYWTVQKVFLPCVSGTGSHTVRPQGPESLYGSAMHCTIPQCTALPYNNSGACDQTAAWCKLCICAVSSTVLLSQTTVHPAQTSVSKWCVSFTPCVDARLVTGQLQRKMGRAEMARTLLIDFL